MTTQPQLLIYEDVKPISKEQHKDLCVKTGSDYSFAKEVNCVPLMAIEFAIGGALRGAGDTRFPLVATILGLLVMRCGLAAIATYMGLPVVYVYAALVGDYVLKGALLIWRFRRGKWKTVVTADDLSYAGDSRS